MGFDEELTERQKQLLALVIRDYIETAQPVSSLRLEENYHFDSSSATIRNELVDLTQKGYLRQTHKFSGRVPTEEGYRYFVRQLMGQTELPMQTKRLIVHQFYQAGSDPESWMRLAASVLATQAQAASLVTAPHVARPVYKHVELINTFGKQVLMVLVLEGGEVSQQMLTLAEPVTQENLSIAAQHINQLVNGLNVDEINALGSQMEGLEADITKLIGEEMRQSRTLMLGEVYRDGLSHVLAEPEFGEAGTAMKAIRILEERPLLEDLLSRTILASDEMSSVQVLIGGEGTWQELREYSVVLARYGTPGLLTGALGVLGPIRMPYGRTVSTVRFVSRVLSHLMAESLIE
jgi:heat-inducible transcriptional repressor